MTANASRCTSARRAFSACAPTSPMRWAWPPKDVHVLTGQVGGSFGMKAAMFPEYICILHATRALDRPVKWTDDRSGSFVSDSHGRNHDVTGELALDAEGNFLALRLTIFANMGAFLSPVAPMPGTINAVKNVQSMYRTPLHRSLDQMRFHQHLARLRLSRRRPSRRQLLYGTADRRGRGRNGHRSLGVAPAQSDQPRAILPYKAASAVTYDSGDFAALTKQALELADGKGFAQAQAREPQARQAARFRHRQFSRSHGAAVEGTRGHYVQRRRHGHTDDRHARFRHGPCHTVRAGLERAARRSLRENFAGARRQRSAESSAAGPAARSR